jgi:hypothetical protein
MSNVSEVLHRIRVKRYPNYLPKAEGPYIARTDNEASLSIEAVCTAAKNRGGFSIHPNVGGVFDKTSQGHDHKKHLVSFRFRTSAALRNLAEQIAIEVEGRAEVSGYIDEFIHISSEAVNGTATPGGMFSIAGHKIKVDGDKSDVGSISCRCRILRSRCKFTGPLAENTSSKVIGLIPALDPGLYQLEIRTQYSPGGFFLKEPRTAVLSTELTVA